MKRYYIVILGSVSLLFWGCASDRQPVTPADKAGEGGGGFRATSWGMDMEEVKAVEKKGTLVPGSPADELIYNDTLLGKITVRITYHFKDGQLRRGTYRLTAPRSIMEYTIFRIILSRKYGLPYQDAWTPTMAETIWLTPETEIDLLAEGSELKRYSLEDPESSRSISLSALKINYYDRVWFGHSIEQTEKEEAEDHETQTFYQKLIGDWVEIYPSYRSCLGYDPLLFPGDPMLVPGEEYEYEPGSSNSDF